MRRATVIDRPLPLRDCAPLRRGEWVKFLLLTALAAFVFSAVPFYESWPAELAFLAVASPLAGYVGLLVCNRWLILRHQGELARKQQTYRDEIRFTAWMEGVNQEAARRGYRFKPNDYKSEAAWRERWAERMSPAAAVSDWEDEEV